MRVTCFEQFQEQSRQRRWELYRDQRDVVDSVHSITDKYERGKLSPREAMASIKKILEEMQ